MATDFETDKKVTAAVADVQYRRGQLSDLEALVELEQACFQSDKMSRRSLRHHLLSEHADLFVAVATHSEDRHQDQSQMLLGYGLVLYRRGTRLARLYSLAVQPQARGRGVAVGLLAELEAAALARHCLYLRLEVAKNNSAAIALYQGNGYQIFGAYSDYYQDHSDALRMQKRIRRFTQVPQTQPWPWYPQTTEFTCGPAALMMAMAGLQPELELSQTLELDLWREATTIFMTSGHGGCHPFGLALAAVKRGFNAQVWVNTEQPLFIEGVRSEHKKNIMATVHQQFFSQCQQAQVPVNFQDFDQQRLAKTLAQGSAVLVLISTFRLAGKKAPHWVLVTGMDDECFYLQDPDYEPEKDHPLDCQYLPIAKQDFEKMASYGAGRLRAAVIIDIECAQRP